MNRLQHALNGNTSSSSIFMPNEATEMGDMVVSDNEYPPMEFGTDLMTMIDDETEVATMTEVVEDIPPPPPPPAPEPTAVPSRRMRKFRIVHR
eukprot:448078-Amphidinium_carterae.1